VSKLTLSVDEAVIERAKRFAAARGLSVSGLVERYLDRLTRPGPAPAVPPSLARLRELVSGARLDVAEHRAHLERKYR
jgi:hypothetical protein